MNQLPGEQQPPMALWRATLLAQMAGARAELFNGLVGLEEELLVDGQVFEGWSAKDLLVHVARWDASHAERIARLADGRGESPDSAPLSNEEHRDAFSHLTFDQALALALKERGSFLNALNALDDDTLQRRFELPGGWEGPLRYWAVRRYRHDAGHVADLRAWRQTLPEDSNGAGRGPGYLLRAAYRATRKAFVAAAVLVPGEERAHAPLDEAWSLKDWLGHLADWDGFLLTALRNMAETGRVGDLNYDGDYERFNAEHAAIRRAQSWTAVVEDFVASRQAILSHVERRTDAQLHATFEHRWGPENSAYKWLLDFLNHEREHTTRLQQLVGLEEIPSYERIPLV